MLFRLVLILLIYSPAAFAINCRNSKSLSHLIANSDAISLISIKDVGILLNRGRLDPLVAITTKENYKNPLLRGLAKNKKARIFSKYLDWNTLRRYSDYVVFMDFQDGAWVPKECGLLPITLGNKVKGACELISDLFNETPFRREQLCTLIHPNHVALNVLKSEIAKRLLDEVSFQGKARVVKVEPYIGQNRFYRIYVEFPAKDRARFFGLKKLSDSNAVKILYKINNPEEQKAYQRLYKGSLLEIDGFWTSGNFVLNSL